MLSLQRQQPKRCAIYTRKSFDPPFGQEVTSLEAQRTICASYIESQQHKSWVTSDKGYDDAGRTGAHLDRPALQALMADIELGLVDIVVVYKLDRITRTLLDFVRLIDFFERFDVAFVSITQNFDTSDSMGRLVRNILLTFAQFEREIASDRIRDKKLVMKQRGLWTGGDAPLGYDLIAGKLVINEVEAAAVRLIFATYVETERISAVHKRLLAEGLRRKVWVSTAGRAKGGGPISLTSLHHVLRNRVYIGELASRGQPMPGEHDPIIDMRLWQQAQAVLTKREQFKPRLPRHLLTGLLVDAFGRRMHAREVHGGPASGRYYTSAVTAWAERQRVRQTRVRADALERLVLESIKRLFAERPRLRPILLKAGYHGGRLDSLSEAGFAAAARLERLSERQLSLALRSLVQRVELGVDHLFLTLRVDALAGFLDWDGVGLFALSEQKLGRGDRLHLEVFEAAVTRERRKSWLPLDPCVAPSQPCPKLLALLEDARAAWELVYQHRDLAVPDLAHLLGRKPASFARLLRLTYLAPDIVAAIIDGTQPATLTRHRLVECDLPTDWSLQRRLLGFTPRQEHWSRGHLR